MDERPTTSSPCDDARVDTGQVDVDERRASEAAATSEAGAAGKQATTSGTEDDHEQGQDQGQDQGQEQGQEQGRSKDRADKVAERIAIPVLIAALAAVPAVFLTLLDEPYQSIGEGLNTISGGVLIAETVVLFLVSSNRMAWLKRNWWMIALAAIIVPAIIFTIAGLQLLRVAVVLRFVLSGVRFIGAFRIIRVGRILKAGRLVRERFGLDNRWQRATTLVVTLLAAVFVGVVLADPQSQTRGILEDVVDWVGWVGVLIAGLILGAATYIVYTQKRRDAAAAGDEQHADRDDEADDTADAVDTALDVNNDDAGAGAEGDTAREATDAGDPAGANVHARTSTVRSTDATREDR